MEGSGGLRCLKSGKTKVNPALNTLVKPLVLVNFFLSYFISLWGCYGFFLLALVTTLARFLI